MPLSGLLENDVLISMLIAWSLAQVVKPPLYYFLNHKWSWAPLFSPGGMPSSHSALMVSATVAIGLHDGFHTPIFALACAATVVVLYDAAGVRRQAGIHAHKINIVINELLQGHPISEQQLREVLGHTPLEVLGGVIWGTIVSVTYWLLIVSLR
ncbi:MAG: divergent PAP2 family protein [Anaerolineales bacterium]|jgi:acid phosphatase family membrane protein YuiD|nr:divergent PAP2 family protein [Anaerolineales bacterium]